MVVDKTNYSREFEDLGEGLKQGSYDIRDTTKDLYNRAKRTLSSTRLCKDSTAPVDTPFEHVLNVMNWTGLMLLLGGVASILAAYVFGPILGLFFNRWGAGFLAIVGLPIYELITALRNDEEGANDASQRFFQLSVALTQGLLSGFALANYHLSAQPIACVTPLLIAYLFPTIVDRFGENCRQVVGICAALALIANLALGLLTGFLTAPYFFLSIFYVSFTVFILQHSLQNVHGIEDKIHLYHVVLFTGLLAIKTFFFLLFGYTAEQLAAKENYH